MFMIRLNVFDKMRELGCWRERRKRWRQREEGELRESEEGEM